MRSMHTVLKTSLHISKNLSTQTCVHVLPEGISRQRSGKDAIRKKIPTSKNRDRKKLNKQSGLIPLNHIGSRIGSYFPNSWPLSYLNLTKI